MTHPKVELRIQVRLQSGRKIAFWIGPFDPPQKSAECIFTLGTYSANTLPPSAGAPNGIQHPAPAPADASRVGITRQRGPSRGVVFRGLGRPSRQQQNTTQEDLRALYAARAELARDKTILAIELAPAWERRDYIKEQIVVTHNGRFCIAGKSDRVPLWRELIEISETRGKHFARYTEICVRVKQCTREIKKLEKEEERKWKKLKAPSL